MDINKNSVYRFSVNADKKVLDISSTLYGIFFEDINRCADGGIYAEMVQNRSFENFSFKNYNDQSGENGASAGKEHTPLRYWYGDTDKVEVLSEGGIEEYFGVKPVSGGLYYIRAGAGAVLINRGFGSEKELCGMSFKKDERYELSFFAKAEKDAVITAVLTDGDDAHICNSVRISVKGGGKWDKYEAVLHNTGKDCLGQLKLVFSEECYIDMVSMFPENVWGCSESDAPAARKNYLCNPNYRLRRDLMQTLYDMHPSFMRFPGGCISEGSFIWDNVYDWKDSVGDPALRKENFNVWGYNMTMGLGYMEYFQMAEDLGAEPLPVMACGILCQARSDYVNPAGGKLREKYIRNFTDLIDFAIGTDFKNNEWSRLRKEMGHEAPFGLHYLGIGNENWGDEFYADFEAFYHEIKKFIDEKYPEQGITIISTAGAQADDDAMKKGWSFICGGYKGSGKLRFTDGEKSWEEDVTPYKHKKNYLDTIVDEHYYRSNDYLLENADRYDYYQRGSYTGCDSEVTEKNLTPKVFVGEYASTDKNTLRGAVAEAAVMTGFERNGDIVRMAATAPLFNQPMDDGTFRWTPDCIWFGKDSVRRTPTYFVQQMFMKNTGKKLLETREYLNDTEYRPCGGFTLSASNGRVKFISLSVETPAGEREFDFKGAESADELLKKCGLFCSDISKISVGADGIIIDGTEKTVYIYSEDKELSEYKLTAKAEKLDENAVIETGAGLRDFNGDISAATITRYCVGDSVHGTGLKVVKNGREGYTMGDFASSVYAGNLRAYYTGSVPANTEICSVLDYGRTSPSELSAYYCCPNGKRGGELCCRLSAHAPEIYEAATADERNIYVKLVNASDEDKKVSVEIIGAKVKNEASLTVLTASQSDCGTENINWGEKETVTPSESVINGRNGRFDTVLPAQSVNIFRMKTC